MYHLKRNPRTITYYGKKWNQKQVHPRVIDSPNLPRDTRVKVTLVARTLPTPVAQKLCRCEHDVFTSRTYVHSWALLLIEIFCCFSRSIQQCVPWQVPNKATKHRLVRTFRDTGSVCDKWATEQLKLRSYKFQALNQLKQRDTAARIQYCH
jgi:hypothetical protein